MTAVLRLIQFFHIDLFKDVTYDAVENMTWTDIEPGVYMVAATLASLRPLVHYLLKDTRFRSLIDRFSLILRSRHTSQDMKSNQAKPTIKKETTITLQTTPQSARFTNMNERKDIDWQSTDVSSADSARLSPSHERSFELPP